MSENMTPQDTEEELSTTNSGEKEKLITKFGETPVTGFLMHCSKLIGKEFRHFKTFFSDPVQYFKEYKPRKNILADFFAGTINLAIVAYGLLMGTLSVSFRRFYYSIWGPKEMGFWGSGRTIGAFIAIMAAFSVYNFFFNKKVKGKEWPDKVKYSLRLIGKIAIPFLIGILVWYIIVMFTPELFDWETDHWTNPHTNFWEISHPYIAFFMMGIWAPVLLYNLVWNEQNRELNFIRRVIYNLRLTFRTGLPMAIGFFLLLIIVMVNPTGWHVYRLAIMYTAIIHVFLVWQMIIFGSQIYATSGKKGMAMILPLLILIGFIVAEKLVAMHYNDVIWQDPSILSMIREYVFGGFTGK